MHEVIGHGSGRMAPGVNDPPHRLLGEQYSSIEEARADLVALYFLPDPKLVELGIVPADDHGTDLLTGSQAEVVRRLIETYLQQTGGP